MEELCAALVEAGFIRVSDEVLHPTSAPTGPVAGWLFAVTSEESGVATRVYDVRYLGRASAGAPLVSHESDQDAACLHKGSDGSLPEGSGDADLRLWCSVHLASLRLIERDLTSWEVRLLLRTADRDADLGLMSRLSRYRLSTLLAGVTRIEHYLDNFAGDDAVAAVGRDATKLRQRIMAGYNLLSTVAMSQLIELQYEESGQRDQLNRTVTLFTVLLLAPSLVAGFAGALSPGELERGVVLLLASGASALVTFALLPGESIAAHLRRLVVLTLLAFLGLVGALVWLLLNPRPVSGAVVGLAAASCVLGVSRIIRCRGASPRAVPVPIGWRREYSRWRNDLQRPDTE